MDRFQALRRICFNNWHYMNQKIVSLHPEINFFTGHSGSGKSTVLDAIQLVLYADTNGRGFFNKAAKEDSDRTLIEYLRGMKHVQENGASSYLRNQNFSSTIVLEWEDTEKQELQCIGVAFDVDTASNDVNRLFFRHTGGLLENEYRIAGRPFTTGELRDYLKSHYEKEEIYYGRTNEAFRAKLYEEYFGGLEEKKFVSLFKRAIPFRMDTKLEEFVKEYICVKQDIQIENMQESVAQYIRMKRKLEEVRLEIEALEAEKMQYLGYDRIRKERTFLLYHAERLELLQLTEEIKLRKQKRQHLLEEQQELKKKRETMDLERERLGKERDQIIVAMENSDSLHLSNEIASLSKLKDQYERGKKTYDRVAKGLLEWEDTFCFQLEEKEALAAFLEYRVDEAQLLRLKEAIAAIRQEEQEKKQAAQLKQEQLNTEIVPLKEELQQLKMGEKVYPRFVLQTKEYLMEELAKKYQKEIKVEILSDVIELKSEEWRKAIEGYMGNNKLALITEPKYAKEALELYRTMDPAKYHKAILIDTEELEKNQKSPMEGALCEEILTQNPYARRFVDYFLGTVIKCGSMAELRMHKKGITKDCILYQGYRLQHMNPQKYVEQAYIGSNALKEKIEWIKSRKDKLQKQMEPYETTILQANRILAREALSEDISQYMEYKADVRTLLQTTEEINTLKKRVEERRETSAEEWMQKERALSQAIKAHDQRKEELIKNINYHEAALRKINEEMLQLEEDWTKKTREFQPEEKKEEAYQDFMKGKEEESYQKWRTYCLQNWERLAQKEKLAYEQLMKARQEYQRMYAYRGFSLTSQENEEYELLLNQLKSERLFEFLERANKQAKVAVLHFKTDFVFKIRDAIKEAMQQKEELNRVLKKLDFGKDKYQLIITKSSKEEGKFYDMFMDPNLEIHPDTLSDTCENQMNLFSMEHESKYKDYIDELLELFMPPETGDSKALEEARENLEKYADYRTYLSFDMEQRVEGLPPMRLSRMLSKNSGGEGQNPLYVALLASFAQVYKINQTASLRRPMPRLVILDEAFSKMDGEKVGSCIGLIRNLGVQAIISATNDKIQNYVDYVDKTFVFANPNKSNISIQEFGREELKQE